MLFNEKKFFNCYSDVFGKRCYFANNISSDRLVHMGMSGFVVALAFTEVYSKLLGGMK